MIQKTRTSFLSFVLQPLLVLAFLPVSYLLLSHLLGLGGFPQAMKISLIVRHFENQRMALKVPVGIFLNQKKARNRESP